ncbi:MAG: MBL fold metallo-hydrolase [Oscillospiraceae bacterium]|nr:MBL fold metallo-hydrolase [Oscillospiraceae bacterium]
MKIELIGTGAACAKKNSACALINNNILIDVPNGVCRVFQNVGYELSDIEGCIITHFHGDHYFDIPFLLLHQSLSKSRNKSLVIAGPKGVQERIETLTKMAYPNLWSKMQAKLEIHFIEYKESEVFHIHGLTFKPIRVIHGSMEEAYGGIISDGTAKLGVTGDSGLCEGVLKILEESDYMLADTSKEKEGTDSHMGLEDILKLADENKNKTIIATHMKDDTRLLAEKIEVDNIVVGDDGMILEI